MAQEHKSLLNFVRLLHKAHEGDRPKPFNLFSVLRTSHDEVNLHSRFLAALLDHRDHGTQKRENLKDFVEAVLGIAGQFDWTQSSVHRERDNIDILITIENQSAHQLAIVIENKIYARDQDRQLDRYVETVSGMGFEEIHPVYLTLHGDDPSSVSLGSMETSDPESHRRLQPLGYNSGVFQDWLKGCQKRAFDEPELRGSIVQYLRLVRELTGTDRKGGYMGALKELLKQGNNLSLARHIRKALTESEIELEVDLWKRVKQDLGQIDLDFEDDGHVPGRTIEEAVANCHRPNSRNKYYYGMVCPIARYETLDLRVCIDAETGVPQFCYGVSGRYRPEKTLEGEDEYAKARELLEQHLNAPEGTKSPTWPYWRYASIAPDAAMSSQEDANKLIAEIAEQMKGIHKAVSSSPAK